MKRNTLDHLMILRFAACVMVVLHHVMFQWDRCPIRILFADGPTAVWCFFTLSGYLMGKGFISGRYQTNFTGVTNFFNNRAVRILPLAWLLLLPLAIRQLAVAPAGIEHWFFLLRSMVLAVTTNEAMQVNGPLWSVVIEWRFYMMTPLLFWLLWKLKVHGKGGWTLIGAVLAAGCLAQYHGYTTVGMNHWVPNIYVSFLYNVNCFTVGVLLNFVMPADSFATPKNIRLGYYMLIAWYLLTALNVGSSDEHWVHAMLIQPITVIVTAAFIFIVDSDRTRNRSFSMQACRENPARYWEWGGVLTYGIYLFHSPVLGYVEKWFTNYDSYLVIFTLMSATLLISAALALIAHLIIEIPSQRMKRLAPKKPSVSDPPAAQTIRVPVESTLGTGPLPPP